MLEAAVTVVDSCTDHVTNVGPIKTGELHPQCTHVSETVSHRQSEDAKVSVDEARGNVGLPAGLLYCE